jgi:RNA polymerase sigma-70 factor, ECF subfamily
VLTRSALEDLYERLEKPLYNVIYRWTWHVDDARDLVQETFLRLWRMRDRVEMETVTALAYRIGINLASNRRRSRRLWRLLSLETVVDHPHREARAHQDLEQEDIRRAVRRAIQRLPERLRRVILLAEYSGLSYREISTILGIPEGTVGSRRHAAVRHLRRSLGKLRED